VIDPTAFPQWRRDPVVGRWVIVAPERATRPTPKPAAGPSLVGSGDDCPFCLGHEDRTPDEIAAWREPGMTGPSGWLVRVVPNRYPAVKEVGELRHARGGVQERCTGVGIHEVIVDCPHHRTSMAAEPHLQFRALMHIYRERMAALGQDARLMYGMLFKNVGAAGGASLEHPHSQLIGIPMVPHFVAEELVGGRRYHQTHGRCVWCAAGEQEHWQGERVVFEGRHVLAVAPYASRVPFEVWIQPRRHESHFERTSDAVLDDLAGVFKAVLTKLERAMGVPGYNCVLHTAPYHTGEMADFHWHWEIIPRMTTLAGFEWGTGQTINPLPPEQAAAILRRC
jgi:UDPglucose--hexose-1-phosphate uridylyltransferase